MELINDENRQGWEASNLYELMQRLRVHKFQLTCFMGRTAKKRPCLIIFDRIFKEIFLDFSI